MARVVMIRDRHNADPLATQDAVADPTRIRDTHDAALAGLGDA